MVEQRVDHLPGRYRADRVRVEELPVETGAGRPPGGGPRQYLRALRRAGAWRPVGGGGVGTRGGHHQRPRQGGDQHGVVHRRAGVGDPDLDGGVVRRQPGVEVDHSRVADHTAADQRRDGAVVVGGTGEVGRWADGRPAGHDDRAVRGVAGVLALEERRTGAHRQQGRQPSTDPSGDPHGQVPVVDPHVHLAGAHLLLVDQLAVLGGQPLVAPVRKDAASAGTGCRYRADAGHGQAEAGGGVGQLPPPGQQVAAQVREAGVYPARGLDRGALQLGPGVGRVAEQDPARGRHEIPGVRVEKVELLLHAQRRPDLADAGRAACRIDHVHMVGVPGLPRCAHIAPDPQRWVGHSPRARTDHGDAPQPLRAWGSRT